MPMSRTRIHLAHGVPGDVRIIRIRSRICLEKLTIQLHASARKARPHPRPHGGTVLLFPPGGGKPS